MGLLFLFSVSLLMLENFFEIRFSFIVIGGILAIIYLIYSIKKPEIIIYTAIIFSGLSGSLSLINFGNLPFSGSGIFTITLLVNSAIVIISRIKYKPWIDSIKAYWHFSPFLFILFFRAITSVYIFEGIQLFFLFLTPILIGIVARRELMRGWDVRRRVETSLLLIPLLPILVIMMNFLSGNLQITTLGFRTVIGLGLGPRPLALFLLPILALLVGKWKYSPKLGERILLFLGSMAITVVIITSLSRVASVIALLVIIPSRFLKKWYHPATLLTVVFGIGILLYWFSLPSVQERFFPGGVESFKFDLSSFQSIDTQGRRNLWALTWNESFDNPIIGKGTGSSSQLILSTFPPLEHPHNDYLRVFHDLGIVGLFAFIFAWAYQILHNLKYWIIFDKQHNISAYYHLAAMIATIAICISFLTDNTITYVFVLIPLNIIYGLADALLTDDKTHYQMQYSV